MGERRVSCVKPERARARNYIERLEERTTSPSLLFRVIVLGVAHVRPVLPRRSGVFEALFEVGVAAK